MLLSFQQNWFHTIRSSGASDITEIRKGKRKRFQLPACRPVCRVPHRPARCHARCTGWLTGRPGLYRTTCRAPPGHYRNLPVVSRRHSRFLPDWSGATPGGTGSPTRLPGAPSGGPDQAPGCPVPRPVHQPSHRLDRFPEPFFWLFICLFSPTALFLI